MASKSPPSFEDITKAFEQFYQILEHRHSVWIGSSNIPQAKQSILFEYVKLLYKYTYENNYITSLDKEHISDDNELIISNNGSLKPPDGLLVSVPHLYSFWIGTTHHDYYGHEVMGDAYTLFSKFVIKSLTKYRLDFPDYDNYFFWTLAPPQPKPKPNKKDEEKYKDKVLTYIKDHKKLNNTLFTDAELAILGDISEDTIRQKDRSNTIERSLEASKNEMTSINFKSYLKPISPRPIEKNINYFAGRDIKGRGAFRDYSASISLMLRTQSFYSCQFSGNYIFLEDDPATPIHIPNYSDRTLYMDWINSCGVKLSSVTDALQGIGLSSSAIKAICSAQGSVTLQTAIRIDNTLQSFDGFKPFINI